MTIYALYSFDGIKSLHKTREGALKAAVQSLRDEFTPEELDEFAQDNGYKSFEEHLAPILEKDAFDKSYSRWVVDMELKD